MNRSGYKGTQVSSIGIVFSILCIVTSIFQESRAFFIGTLLATTVILASKYQLKLIWKIYGVSLLLATVIINILFVKTDSSLGRKLIYKVSYAMFNENPIYGIGLGGFSRRYLDYQGKYFSAGQFTTKELLLADNTYYAFNDYYQLLIEGGLLALSFVILMIYCLYRSIAYLLTKIPLDLETFLSLFILISLSTAAVFTHIYDSGVWTSLLLISISHLAIRQAKRKAALSVASAVLLCANIYLLYPGIIKYQSYQKLEEAKTLALAGFNQESLKLYEEIHPDLKTDGYYLYAYGRQLAKLGHTENALAILHLALKKYKYSEIYTDLAKCYEKLGQLEVAETQLLTSINMVPNRFNPRFELFNLHLKANELDKAKTVGDKLLSLPIKVPSARINFIRAEVKKYLALK